MVVYLQRKEVVVAKSKNSLTKNRLFLASFFRKLLG